MARSVLIAGDSNLKQLPHVMTKSVLCVPGARIFNDQKGFQDKLSYRLKEHHDVVLLHLGSNDACEKIPDLVIQHYRKILDSVYEAIPSVTVGVTEVLPRRWNRYVGRRGNRNLPLIQENIRQLNVRIRAMAKEYQNCIFVEYEALFNPEIHLAFDGLHVNRAGTIVLKEVMELSGENIMREDFEPVCMPPSCIEKDRIAKLSYADVVKFCPSRTVDYSATHCKNRKDEQSTPVPVPVYYLIPGQRSCIKNRPPKMEEKCTESSIRKQVTYEEIVRKPIKQKKVHKCPECPVTCSREDYLLDHVLKHTKKAHLTVLPVTDDQSGNGLHVEKGLQHCIPHTFDIECLTEETGENGDKWIQSDEPRCNTNNYNIWSLSCGNIIGYFWKNFGRLELLLAGDVEENPGPVMIKCLWGQCTQDSLADLPELHTHLISHMSADSACQWNDCCFPPCHDEKRLQTHVLQHVYLEIYKFQSLDEWVSSLPSGRISRICTDLHLCPPHLRCKLQYLLFDDFKIPKKFPYTPEDHEKHLLYMEAKDEGDFMRSIERFLQKRKALGENWTSGEESPNANNDEQSGSVQSSVQKSGIFCVKNPAGTDQSVIKTNRPELTTHSQRNVVLKFIDESQRIKRKYQEDKTHLDIEEDILKKKLISNLDTCREAILTEDEVISTFFNLKFLDKQNKQLHNFEEAAITIATYPDCTEGVFVFSCFKHKLNNQDSSVYYIRYLESGYYQNFMTDTFVDLFCEHKGTNRNCIILSNVLTSEDIHQKKSMKTDINRKTGIRPDKSYNHNLKMIKEARLKLIDHVKNFDGIQMQSNLVHCIRHKYKANVMNDTSDKCYLQCDLDIPLLDCVRENLRSFPERRSAEIVKKSPKDFLNDIPSNFSLLEQSIHINLLSNDCNRFKENKKTLRFIHRFSISKSPTSLRNSTLQSYKTKSFQKLFRQFSSVMVDTGESLVANAETINVDEPEDIPTKKRKKSFTPRAKVVTKEMIHKSIGRLSEQNLMRVDIYDIFKRYLIGDEGTLIVQVSNEDILVVIINDYDDETGAYKEADYVKTTRQLVEDGFYYTCTCKIYRTLLECIDSDGSKPYDTLDMNGVKCMHCRFLNEELVPNMERKDNSTYSVLQEKVQWALVHIDETVIELRTKNPNTKKFSVLTHDDQIFFVHLSYNMRTQRYILSCMNGFCKSQKGSKKNVNSLKTDVELCMHLKAIKNNPNYWNEFASAVDEDEENIQDDINETDNTDIVPDREVNIQVTENNNSSNFNVDDGMWCFPCESTHSPRKQDDPQLSKNIQVRSNLWINFESPVLENGCFKGPNLIVDVPDHLCPCGAGWNSSLCPEGKKTFDRLLTVYTSMAPVSCKVFARNCVKEESPCKLKWDEGHSLSVHVVTKETAAGDEIGWNYVNQVMNSSITFSSFCNLMTMTYKMYNPKLRGFMDPSVFRKWWFSWASSMKIDFRKPCPVCKFTPKQLACDGTRVGVGFRHASFDEIHKPDDPRTVHPTVHLRMTRCFLSDKLNGTREHLKIAREHLDYLSSSVLNDKLNLDNLLEEDIQNRNAILLFILDDDVKISFQRFLGDMSEDEKIAYATVMRMLASTAPVSSLIPLSYASYLKDLLDHLSGTRLNPGGDCFFNTKKREMREYAPELRDLIGTSMQNSVSDTGQPFLPNDILLLLYSLLHLVLDMEIIEPDLAIPQFESYNPPKYGRAYYFSETGRRLRPIRKFEIDKEKKGNTVYDDRPCEHDLCEKYFSKTHAAARGTSTLFLWFCPNHGHCYGFHMTYAEGRKDPSASLYSYLETPPTDIFYDFACSLNEYCLNRESGYYKKVRFFHDIFHGFSHKCSNAFRSSRLLGFDTINSEICEQFNSFIQCIKGSARQMTQEHFCFYLQFFLHQWNEKKETKFQKRMTVAPAGL